MSMGKRKYESIFSQGKSPNKKTMDKFIYNGKVVSVNDPDGLGRIRVRIMENGIDNFIDDVDLPFSYPLLDKSFHIKPKLGDGIKVILGDLSKPYNDRYYFSRLIPQYKDIEGTQYQFGTVLSEKPLMNKKKNNELSSSTDNIFPKQNEDDVQIVGKNNSDLRLNDRCAELRAGKHLIDQPTQRNNENTGYIKTTYKPNENSDTNEYESINLLYSDYNMLVSHKTKNVNFDNNPTEEVINQMKEKALSLPYGEILVEFIDLMRDAFLKHVHPYPNRPPVSDVDYMNKVKDFDTQKILSKNNKII